MKYNVGDKVRVAPDNNTGEVSYADEEDNTYRVLLNGTECTKWYAERELSPLTEGQDEQNELWEDVIDCVNSNDDPIAATNILKQSFTIKRKL